MLTFYPGGARTYIPGVQVVQAGAGDTPWWLTAGITPVCAYAAKGAADLASSYINLANPGTFNAAPGVAPTWDATNGWTHNGTTQYLTTGIVPAAGWTMLVLFSGAANTGMPLGSQGSSNSRFYIRPMNGVTYGSGGALTVGPTLAFGVVGIAGQQGYRNGAANGGTIAAWNAAGAALAIGANNASGTLGNFFAGNIQAIAIFNSILNATQVALMTTAMQNL